MEGNMMNLLFLVGIMALGLGFSLTSAQVTELDGKTIKPGTIIVPIKTIPPRIKSVQCDLFASYQDAYNYWLYWKSQNKEPKTLDRDGDGLPCECLKGGPGVGKLECK
jgi:hypothetical protein